MTDVSGTLRDAQGSALSNASVVAQFKKAIVGYDGGAVVSNERLFTSDGSGVLTMSDLTPGAYDLFVWIAENDNTAQTLKQKTPITVLDQATQTLENAIIETIGDVTPTVLQQAIDAKDAAEAAAAATLSPSADAFIRGSSDGTAFNNLTAAQVRDALNVEDGADVTDTANVTAAGALMDSEVTNLAAIKAFDPADYATSAEGDLAATALQPGDAVDQTSTTGSAELPAGTTAERDATPSAGYLRFNSTDGAFEGYDGSEWGALGGDSPVKAWVNFDGTGTVSIRESFNVSSITDNGTGDYTVNFATALTDANYAVVGSCNVSPDVSEASSTRGVVTPKAALSSSNVGIFTSTGSAGTSAGDVSRVSVAIFR